jgi:hypothetical protein
VSWTELAKKPKEDEVLIKTWSEMAKTVASHMAISFTNQRGSQYKSKSAVAPSMKLNMITSMQSSEDA